MSLITTLPTNMPTNMPTNIQGGSADYIGPRYAPTGDQTVGDPFPSFRDYAGRNTQWQPVSASMSTLKKQMNLPNNNTYFRNGMINNAIGTGNKSLHNWVDSTQGLDNVSFDTMYCTSDSACNSKGPGFTCNSNYEPWPDSNGNQSGSVCSFTAYPEIDSGKYIRKHNHQGGIGKACTTDNDCAKDSNGNQLYFCNNITDFVGSQVQQTGYCAHKYDCGDGKDRYVGYPYNSGIPFVPPVNQNNNGQGYSTAAECANNAMAQQNCVQMNGAYFATYPGYCPVGATLRKGGPQGALHVTNQQELEMGFSIPSWATNQQSFLGGSGVNTKVANAFNSGSLGTGGMNEPRNYDLAMNPRPSNY